MTDHVVLALDTSAKATGWASDPPLGTPIFAAVPCSGVIRLGSWKAADVDSAYLTLDRFVHGFVERYSVTDVVIERALSVYAHSGFQKRGAHRNDVDFDGDARKDPDLAEALLGFVAVAQTAARRAGAKPWVVASSTVRKHFIGNGRHPDPKAAVMHRCRTLGWKPEDHNAGDALATWDYAKSLLSPGWAWKSTPLLQGA